MELFDPFKRRLQEMLLEESKQPMQWWGISFAGDEGFRGFVVMDAQGPIEASLKCKELGMDPGGQMLTIPLGNDFSMLPPREWRRVLMSREDVDRVFAATGGGRGIADLDIPNEYFH
jgi:hypothetical protein